LDFSFDTTSGSKGHGGYNGTQQYPGNLHDDGGGIKMLGKNAAGNGLAAWI